jgi:hypothetical protein
MSIAVDVSSGNSRTIVKGIVGLKLWTLTRPRPTS